MLCHFVSLNVDKRIKIQHLDCGLHQPVSDKIMNGLPNYGFSFSLTGSIYIVLDESITPHLDIN